MIQHLLLGTLDCGVKLEKNQEGTWQLLPCSALDHKCVEALVDLDWDELWQWGRASSGMRPLTV